MISRKNSVWIEINSTGIFTGAFPGTTPEDGAGAGGSDVATFGTDGGCAEGCAEGSTGDGEFIAVPPALTGAVERGLSELPGRGGFSADGSGGSEDSGRSGGIAVAAVPAVTPMEGSAGRFGVFPGSTGATTASAVGALTESLSEEGLELAERVSLLKSPAKRSFSNVFIVRQNIAPRTQTSNAAAAVRTRARRCFDLLRRSCSGDTSKSWSAPANSSADWKRSSGSGRIAFETN